MPMLCGFGDRVQCFALASFRAVNRWLLPHSVAEKRQWFACEAAIDAFFGAIGTRFARIRRRHEHALIGWLRPSARRGAWSVRERPRFAGTGRCVRLAEDVPTEDAPAVCRAAPLWIAPHGVAGARLTRLRDRLAAALFAGSRAVGHGASLRATAGRGRRARRAPPVAVRLCCPRCCSPFVCPSTCLVDCYSQYTALARFADEYLGLRRPLSG